MARHAAVNAHPAQGDFAYAEEELSSEGFNPWDAAETTAKPKSRMGKLFPGTADKQHQQEDLVPLLPSKGTWKIRVIAGFLWFLLVLCAAGGAYAFLVTKPKQTKAYVAPPDTTSAATFAQTYVVKYLERGSNGNQDELKRFYPGLGQIIDVPPNQYLVFHSNVAQTEIINDDYFAITVAVDLWKNLEPEKATKAPIWQPDPVTKYYRVGVIQGIDKDGFSTLAATSLPFLVPELKPSTEIPKSHISGSEAKPATEKVRKSVEQFFNSYLTGQGDLSFVVTNSKTSHLRPLGDIPFAKVDIQPSSLVMRYTDTEMGRAGNEVEVTVPVKATDAQGFVQNMSYTLLMRWNNDDRWLVEDIASAPPLAKTETNKEK